MLHSLKSLYTINYMRPINPTFSIIIPAFNEENRIGTTLLDWVNFLSAYYADDYEILIIIDGCTDHTLELVAEICSQTEVIRSFYSPTRLGKGGALLEAFERCKGAYIFFTDADGSLPVTEFPKFVRALKTHDLVIGTRYFKGSIFLDNVCFSRFMASRAFNALLKLFFPQLRNVYDTQCGAKILKKNIVDHVNGELLITDFAFDVNLLLSALNNGFKFGEVPVQNNHVENGSKVSRMLLKTSFKMFFSLVRLRFYYSKFRPFLYCRFLKCSMRFFLSVLR